MKTRYLVIHPAGDSLELSLCGPVRSAHLSLQAAHRAMREAQRSCARTNGQSSYLDLRVVATEDNGATRRRLNEKEADLWIK